MKVLPAMAALLPETAAESGSGACLWCQAGPTMSCAMLCQQRQVKSLVRIPRQTTEVSYGQYSEEAGILAAMMNERAADGSFAMQAASYE
jgi:hypothetical protein